MQAQKNFNVAAMVRTLIYSQIFTSLYVLRNVQLA
jgi:hypothetical protein